MKYISSQLGFPSVNSCTPSRPIRKNDNRLVLSKLLFKFSIIMPKLVPLGFVYKHGSPCFICRIKRTLRLWFGSNCVLGISFAYLYAYSKSFGYFNYLIGYLPKYSAYLELSPNTLHKLLQVPQYLSCFEQNKKKTNIHYILM